MRKDIFAFALMALLSGFAMFTMPWTACADTTKLFLNDIDVTGISSQRFENVTVYIDITGNVHIIAPNINIPRSQDTTQAAVRPQTAQTDEAPGAYWPPLTMKPTTQEYYLVAVNNTPGLLGFNVDVYINDSFAFTINQNDTQTVKNITERFRVGTNKIQYRVILAADSGRSSNASIELFVSSPDPSKPKVPLILSGEEGKLFIYSRDITTNNWYERRVIAK